MRWMLLALVVGCSSGPSSAECTNIDKEIHDAAVRRGLDPNTVCDSTDASVVKSFGDACEKQRSCN